MLRSLSQPARPTQELEASGEKSLPGREQPSTKPKASEQPPPKKLYDKNLWQQAFDNLDLGIQSFLRAHGFDGSGTPQGAKQSTDELIGKVNEKQEQVQKKEVFRSIVRQLPTTAQNPDRAQTKLYEVYKRCQEYKSKLSP